MELILEPGPWASGAADHRQTEAARKIVGRSAELDLGTPGPDRFGSQVGEEKARV